MDQQKEEKQRTLKQTRKPRGNYRDPIVGFFNKIKIDKNGCWIWMAGTDKDGYGTYSPYRKKVRAHRYSYELFKGKIPNGLVIDHLCKNTSCVNPYHLEVVTNKENILRGNCPSAINSRKKYCKNGHLLSGENLYIQEKTGKRFCRECDRKIGKEYYERQKKNKSTK